MNNLLKKHKSDLTGIYNQFTNHFKMRTTDFVSLVEMYIEARESEIN
jgi:hypothetical protein